MAFSRASQSDRRGRLIRTPGWRREALRTTLWVVPSVLILAAGVLFAICYAVDRSAAAGKITLPAWVDTGGADAARTILTAIAAAVITVVGVVFSITIVALTLASTQFGPRMLRNFIRDFGTQFTLGTFVATCVFSVLTLATVSSRAGAVFVPHLSATVALGLTLIDLGVLIFFIHHVTKSIQLTEVVHNISRDLGRSIDRTLKEATPEPVARAMSIRELEARLDAQGAAIPATASGYLQAIGHHRLVRIAERSNAVVQLLHRPGHFVVEGGPLAVVWPAGAAPALARALARAHVVGPNRTLFQDLQFAIDQLVEIALRALSPAVNDTFTALTCIDWLGDALCRLSAARLPDGVFRDPAGSVRVMEVAPRYDRIVGRAYEKIRQAGRGMPAVGIRQLENLAKIADFTIDNVQRGVVVHQADMILRSAKEAVAEPSDLDDVQAAYDSVLDHVHNRPEPPDG